MKLVSQLQGEEEEEELEELASKAPSQPVNDVYEYNANDSILYALSGKLSVPNVFFSQK